MKFSKVLLLCGLVALSAALARGQDIPAISGYVTRAVSVSDFDVNGFRILCGDKTRTLTPAEQGVRVATVKCPSDPPYVGESLVVTYNERNTATNCIFATRIERPRVPSSGEVSGSAVIDSAPAQEPAGSRAPGLIVRADGYRIRITNKTRMVWTWQVHSLAEVKAGDWIKYKGKLDATGVLAAASVEIATNGIDSGEGNLRKKYEYDPSAVPADAKQNYLKDAVKQSLDPKKFPPYKDAAMQARVAKIGNSLVPAYQRDLPDSDPAKLHFRFQVIDTRIFRGTMALPSGIILIHHKVVEKAQNDSQLAAVLAAAIACVLERQEYRMANERKAVLASEVALAAVSPVTGLILYGAGISDTEIMTKEMEQITRVSLMLLHDAGYDIDQAPLAWWLLASEDQKPISEIVPPAPTLYLYQVLGEIWHNPAAGNPQAH